MRTRCSSRRAPFCHRDNRYLNGKSWRNKLADDLPDEMWNRRHKTGMKILRKKRKIIEGMFIPLAGRRALRCRLLRWLDCHWRNPPFLSIRRPQRSVTKNQNYQSKHTACRCCLLLDFSNINWNAICFMFYVRRKVSFFFSLSFEEMARWKLRVFVVVWVSRKLVNSSRLRR